MKFTAQSDDLSDAFSRLKAVASRDTIPILEHVLIEADEGLRLTANDCVVVMRIGVPATVETKGKAAASAKRLAAAFKNLPAGRDVAIELSEGQLSIRCDGSFFRIGTLPVEDFPKTPEEPQGTSFTLTGETLDQALRFAGPAISKEEVKPHLQGIYFASHEGKLRLVATNGASLHSIDLDIPTQWSVLVPERACGVAQGLFAKSESVEISADDVRINFDDGRKRLCSQLLDQTFPENYQVVIANTERRESSLTIDRKEFLAGINRVMGLAADGDSQWGTGVAIRAESGTITLAGSERIAGTLAHDQIAAEGVNGRTDIAFCGRLLRDAIGVSRGEEMVIHLCGERSPVRFEDPAAPNEILIVMPFAMGFPEP